MPTSRRRSTAEYSHHPERPNRHTDLRRMLALYEEAIRQLTLENHALRSGATVVPLPARSRTSPPSRP
ncbi:hypothetical protein [Streptomyces sp. AC555_RSS877]|uniref:hypothetical protein n=1 Tax=Streptomyces sp. AC555_RSS877 TaxID=2823688 RepID=UPI001C265003|nr:hypothetical protein [Streptomyces sp. AC555_RSS877]